MASTPGGGGGSKSGKKGRGGGSAVEEKPPLIPGHDIYPEVEYNPGPTPESYAAAKEALMKMTGLSEQEVKDGMRGVYEFVSNGYTGIRESERKGEPDSRVTNINRLLSKMPKYDGEIYRGMAIKRENLDSFLKELGTGTMKIEAMSSFTSDKKIAQKFTKVKGGGVPVLITVQNKSGVSIRNMSTFKKENEVLVPKGVNYSISKIETTKNGGKIIYLQEN
ncbi:ADP-ribosyltransferase [Floridanema evergladense]|uniref:NAD(+)--protein-arginine ADP-ribosyltransferase n=1 Tax=Floridaenema evergladense BLCC-F167 TaxID=3153639 RepID=A0ABV4WD18_9CYAN